MTGERGKVEGAQRGGPRLTLAHLVSVDTSSIFKGSRAAAASERRALFRDGIELQIGLSPGMYY